MVKHPFTGNDVRATIVGYQNMKSGYIPGYEVMVEENTQCILSAFRNSIITLGKMPVIAYIDNGKAFKNKFFNESIKFEEWSFVQNKKNKKWGWFVKSRVTKQIVAYFVGNRDRESCEEFKNRFPDRYKDTFTFSDLWESYSNVFTENHLSAPKGSGETCHIENFNNVIRQRLARYKRKTIAFSKSDYWHDLITRIFIIQYNLSLRI